jgi:hypothetical protein
MTVYICGDSFAYPDLDYGPCWADLLGQRLSVENLSRAGASNLQIALQVEHAILKRADFVIYLATSSTREDIAFNTQRLHTDLLSRFVDFNAPAKGNLLSYSQHNIDFAPLSSKQKSLLKQYHLEFSDLELDIYKNKLIIEATLHRLRSSGIPFLFDQGGFEHVSFDQSASNYFEEFSSWRSAINLWDYTANQKLQYRPYYHIIDIDTHVAVSEYYFNEITKTA